MNQDSVEDTLNDEVKELFRRHNFEITVPIEYNAMRSVIIRHIDKAIMEYTDAEVIASIHASNEWAKVVNIYRLTNTGRLLKKKFESPQMVNNAVQNSMIVIHQKIMPKNIEKEIFIRLTPCYNCSEA